MSRKTNTNRLPDQGPESIRACQTSKSPDFFTTAMICSLLCLAVAVAFGRSISYDFVSYDDNEYIYENPNVLNGLTKDGVAWAFTTKHAANWHPLTWLSHELDCQLYGLWAGGHRLTNLALHAASTILLFLLLRRMTGELWPSAFVAAVFAVHPLRVESVVWVAERKDVLSGLFFMLTLWAYSAYTSRAFSFWRYVLVVLFFALGLMSKPMLVSLPLVLLLLDYWPLRRFSLPSSTEFTVEPQNDQNTFFSTLLRLSLEKTPLFLLSAGSCLATVWAQKNVIDAGDYIPLLSRFCNAAIAYVAYIGQMFYPANLAVLYPYPPSWNHLPVWKVAGAVFILIAVSGGAFALRRRYRYLLTGWLWYVLMLIPVTGIVQVGAQAMADRYTYLPQIGLYIAVTWFFRDITRKWPHCKAVYILCAGVILTGLIIGTIRQTSYWQNSEALWRRDLSCTSQNDTAHYNLGLLLGQSDRIPEAIQQFQKSIEFNPKSAESYFNLAFIFEHTGRPSEALEYYEQARKITPNDVEIYNNMGITLANLGRFDDAITVLQQGIPKNQNFPKIHNSLGIMLAHSGQTEKAIEHFQQAMKLNPNFTEAYFNLALAYAESRRPEEALSAAKKALELAKTNQQTDLTKKIEAWLNSYATENNVKQ